MVTPVLAYIKILVITVTTSTGPIQIERGLPGSNSDWTLYNNIVTCEEDAKRLEQLLASIIMDVGDDQTLDVVCRSVELVEQPTAAED